MTDLEITKLCAEAMGGDAIVWRGMCPWEAWRGIPMPYDPLHDDAQAMALAKKFELFISFWKGIWTVSSGIGGHDKTGAQSHDLNRAICGCVAKMQKAKL